MFKELFTESIKPIFKVGDAIKRIDGRDKNVYHIAAIEKGSYIFANLKDSLWLSSQDDYAKV